MMIRLLTLACLLLFTGVLCTQESAQEEEKPLKWYSYSRLHFDTRSTIINKESVGIYGIRIGCYYSKSEKFNAGFGIYSSNLFGLFGNTATKDYIDNAFSPPVVLPAEIGFHYGTLYGEYTLLESKKVLLRTTSQIGYGWVDIDFIPGEGVTRANKREFKALFEQSLKVDWQVLHWFSLIGGVGYRIVPFADEQLKDTFNAPIYIIGFGLDYKFLYCKLFKCKNKKSDS